MSRKNDRGSKIASIAGVSVENFDECSLSLFFAHDPLDALEEHILVPGIIPNRLFVPQTVVINPSLAEHARPGNWPSVIAVMHTGLA